MKKQSKKDNPATLAENWQRIQQEDLPKAFYVYDKSESQSERLVTFGLRGKNKIKSLLETIENPEDFQFVVHLGLRPDRLKGNVIPDKPAFALLLQVYNKKGDWHQNCFELEWDPNSRFSVVQEADPYSGQNAIPAASAYLFVQAWLELPEQYLARPFTAATRVMGERVKAYIFSPAESHSIYLDLKNSNEYCLDIHIGVGLAVWVHPFSFRPVIEVKKAVEKPKKLVHGERLATGLLNGDGDSFYDFSYPDPPGEPD